MTDMNTMNNQLRLVTINTWKCDGDYFARMKLLARELRDIGSDVIICQECFETEDGTVSSLAYLAEELGMQYVLTRARFRTRVLAGRAVPSYSGLGILSRFSLQLIESVALPTIDADGGRNAQFAAVDLGDGRKLLIANVHLTFLKHAESLRTEQLEVIGTRLSAYHQYAFRLVAGDFNAEIDAPEIVHFTADMEAADCYALGNGREPRSPAHGENHFQLHRCVDHLFVLRDAATGLHPAFVDSKIVLDRADPVSGLYPSDHFGVATTLLF